MHKIYGGILLVLIACFALYNTHIYSDKTLFGKVRLSEQAQHGEQLWLRNNCNACHQLYGLGGYLGPDLTNVVATKSPEIIKIFLVSGVRSMPVFSFSEQEKDQLVQFLKEVNETGYYPNKEATIKNTGWVDLHYKK
ncbi:MAG: cytochrome c [Chryseobacterium sp.]|nr:cytochrome c [Chryseobacterium sp.]